MLYHRDILKAAATLASTDPSRPALNGVHVQGGRAEVTDGHQLVRFHPNGFKAEEFPNPEGGLTPLPPEAGVILSRDAIKHAVAATAKSHTLPILHCVMVAAGLPGSGRVQLVATDLSNTHRGETLPVEGPYPNVAQVIPSGDPVLRIGFRAELLARVLSQLARVSDDSAIVTLEFHAPTKAMRFELQTKHGKADGLVMPCRIDNPIPAPAPVE